MPHTPSIADWARFHLPRNKHNVNVFNPHPSLNPRTMFLDERTDPAKAHIEELPNEDDSMCSLAGLNGALSHTRVTEYPTFLTVLGVADPEPPVSFLARSTHVDMASAKSRNTRQPSVEYREDLDNMDLDMDKMSQDECRFEVIRDGGTAAGDEKVYGSMSMCSRGSDIGISRQGSDVMSVGDIPE